MEYSSEFAKRLIEAAEAFSVNSSTLNEADRTVLYLSCLSCEISLKALLENAGYSLKELKKISHNLSSLLNEVSSCKFAATGQKATSIRSKEVIQNTSNGTVGTLLTAEISGASQYPNEIRYGEIINHYPPKLMLNCAKIVNKWCKLNTGNLVRA